MAEHTDIAAPADIALLRRSPAAHLAELMRAAAVTGERAVSLTEIPFLAMAGIRVQPGSDAAAAVTDVLGCDLPAGCGEVTGSPDGLAVLWLGPDEFLLVTGDRIESVPGLDAAGEREPGALPTLAVHPTVQQLCAVLVDRDLPGQVVDLSANRTTLELSGVSARDVLEKGCPLDLHPRVFGPGRAVSTVLGPVPVVLWQTAEHTYRLLPRASFADYTVRWLADAMREYASAPVA